MATKTKAPKADPRKQCWNCGSKNLLPFLSGVSCGNCQATWTDLPKLASDTLESHRGGMGPNEARSYSPSKSIQNKAAAARKATSTHQNGK